MDNSNVPLDSAYHNGLNRAFIPDKGWQIVNPDGSFTKDPLTDELTGPLEIISVPPSNGGHWLYNLVGKDGNRILPNDVRKIKYFEDGYYIAEDNNEDELINRGDVRGGFRACDYVESSNVILDDGRLLSDKWFDKVSPLLNGYFWVSRGERQNLMDMTGKMLLQDDEENLKPFIGGVAYSIHDGCLYANTHEGRTLVRELKPFPEKGRYSSNRFDVTDGIVGGYDVPLREYLSGYKAGMLFLVEDKENDFRNLLDTDGNLIFKRWYDSLSFTGLRGLYAVRENGKWCLVGLDGNRIGGMLFDSLPKLIGNYVFAVMDDGKHVIADINGNVVTGDISRIMWADSGVWGMHLAEGGEVRHFFHGQGGALLSYAHTILIRRKGLMMECGGVWTLLEPSGRMTPCFVCKNF